MDPSMTFSPANPTDQRLPVTQLDFHQSMNHFKTMFPGIDEDVIETVLRSNNGAVDSTIDQLLQISSENQNNTTSKANMPANPPSYSTSMQSSSPYNLNINSTPKEKVHKSTLKQMNLLGNQSTVNAQSAQSQLIDFDTVDASRKTKSSKFNPPLVGPLPNDFLRITPSNDNKNIINQQQITTVNQNQHLMRQSSTGSSGDHHINHQLLKKKMEENERLRSNSNIDNKDAQYLEDERIALLLQNEEFVQELRRNKEFMSALNYDAMSHNTRVKGFHNENYTGSHSTSTSSGATASSATGGHDSSTQNFSDADFKERIRKMGELSRNKFAQLAGLFSRRKGSGLPSRDNLLLGDQYAQLENDYSDDEYGQKNKSTNKLH